jgi:tetratricopeptide (TPR) repeat protein
MQVENLLRSAEERGRAKDYHGALRFLQQALTLDPYSGPALLAMAEAYRGLQDDDKCLKAWERYLEDHEADARVLTRVGDLHRRRGLPGLALEYYLDALRVDPGHPYALATMGQVHYKEKRHKEALAFWLPLLEKEPWRVETWNQAGNCHRRMGAFALAEPCFRKAIALAPLNPYALFGLADALRGQGRTEEAESWWLRLLEVEPGNLVALTRAGDGCLRLGRVEEAERHYRQALGLGEDGPARQGMARIQQLRELQAG